MALGHADFIDPLTVVGLHRGSSPKFTSEVGFLIFHGVRER